MLGRGFVRGRNAQGCPLFTMRPAILIINTVSIIGSAALSSKSGIDHKIQCRTSRHHVRMFQLQHSATRVLNALAPTHRSPTSSCRSYPIRLEANPPKGLHQQFLLAKQRGRNAPSTRWATTSTILIITRTTTATEEGVRAAAAPEGTRPLRGRSRRLDAEGGKKGAGKATCPIPRRYV